MLLFDHRYSIIKEVRTNFLFLELNLLYKIDPCTRLYSHFAPSSILLRFLVSFSFFLFKCLLFTSCWILLRLNWIYLSSPVANLFLIYHSTSPLFSFFLYLFIYFSFSLSFFQPHCKVLMWANEIPNAMKTKARVWL